MNPMLNVAMQAARQGGQIILNKYDKYHSNYKNIRNKKIEFINKLIYTLQKNMNNIILKFYPHHIISNNNVYNYDRKEDIQWNVNVINGKTNFLNNFPYFCITISVYIQEKIEISVIYDPIKNELFTAVRGCGAQLNGFRTRCHDLLNKHNSIVSLNFKNSHQKYYSVYAKILNKLLMSDLNIRQTGCTTLDYVYLSLGRIECILNIGSKDIFCNAGILHVQESGGLINYFENTYTTDKIPGIICTSNSKCMKFFTKLIK